MKLLGNRKSKRQKLSLKYNIQKRVRENKRRVRKEAKKLGKKKLAKKDPGIPNTWPFKAQMLQELERKKEQKEKEIEQRRVQAKAKAKRDAERQVKESREAAKDKEAERRAKRAVDARVRDKATLVHTLFGADVLLQVLDARDPMGCRCESLEAWALEKGKRLFFVIAKADLVSAQVAAQWLQVLGQVAPTVAVQAEAGREGVKELIQMLGQSVQVASPQAADVPAKAAAVGIVGYPKTGKQVLNRAIRREAQDQANWLLSTIGRLHPASTPETSAAVLHLALRGAAPMRGQNAMTAAVAPLEIIHCLLQRATQQAVMRRYRLPAFEGTEGFLKALSTERGMKSKQGKEAPTETVARTVLAELAAAPGCVCVPAAGATENAVFWASHAAHRPLLQAAMQSQVAALQDRAAGPAAGAMQISSVGLGPAVNISELLADAEADVEMDDEQGADVEDDDDDEEGEEEDLEGEEEESGDMESEVESEEESGDKEA